ncbi:MAG TPA: hypothetical protein VKY89_17840 [Thermoanaerobaculia bacterium]|jgi:hypothetical protein|nr:hypothetical protein [Thermoanaerobaculia bacterium]
MVRRSLFALAVVGVCAMGCHSSTPTSTTGFQLLITTNVANTALTPTIVEATLLLDGVVAADVPESPAAAIAALSAQGSASAGSHVMQIVIAQQTTSPNTYTVTAPVIQIFDTSGTLLKTVQLSTQTASLATGGSISYSFTL